jgi:hypothetical protein
MTENLSTADLAGGTTARPPAARRTDPSTQTRDPKLEGREAESRHTDPQPAERGPTNVDDRAQAAPRPAETAAQPSMDRPSRLPNPAATDGADTSSDRAEPLFPSGEAEGFRTRWGEIQTGFVDEPRSAVEQADGLVAEMMKRLAQVFADERGKLEEQWSRGDDISTEDLRQALRRYRSFMDRLLSV